MEIHGYLHIGPLDEKKCINSTEFQHHTNQQYKDNSKIEEKKNINREKLEGGDLLKSQHT